MGVQLIVIIENVKKVSQEELNKVFGVHVFEYKEGKDITPVWELFEWKGKVYATWNFTPRVFDGMYELFMASLEGDPLSKVDRDTRIKWESLRKIFSKSSRISRKWQSIYRKRCCIFS